MSHEPRHTVSVVIPVFNRSDLIDRAIDSALEQTVAPHEIIVVDDGSTDDTAEVVGANGDSRVRLISQANRGVAAARNRGASEATGRYLLFLDSDDIAAPAWVETLLGLAVEQNAAVVLCRSRHLSDGGGLDRTDDNTLSDSVVAAFLAGTFLVDRSVFNAVGGFDERLRFSENHELGMRIRSHCADADLRLVETDAVLLTIDRSESGGSNPRKLDAILRILDVHGAQIRSDRERHARWLGIAAVEASRHRQPGRAFRYAAHSLVRTPENPRSWFRLFATALPQLARRRWGNYPSE